MITSQMIVEFIQNVGQICPKISSEALVYLKDGLTTIELPAKHFYIQAETIQKEIGFVASGLLRSFYVDENGEEITVGFVKENAYATHYSSFITQTKSKYYFQCLEQSLLLSLSFKHIQAGYENFPDLERYGRLIAEEVLKTQRRRIEGFLFQTAEERYLDFMSESSDLFNRVSLSHLATYLGIQRPSLGRIRKRLMKK